LGPIAHAEDELQADEQNAGVSEDHEDVLAEVVAERIDSRVSERTGNEVKGQVEVGKGEVGEAERNELVNEFDMEEDLAGKGVVRGPDLAEMDEGIDGSEESAIEPAPALRDEFWDGVCRQWVSNRGKRVLG
jgi:hypothetical protein